VLQPFKQQGSLVGEGRRRAALATQAGEWKDGVARYAVKRIRAELRSRGGPGGGSGAQVSTRRGGRLAKGGTKNCRMKSQTGLQQNRADIKKDKGEYKKGEKKKQRHPTQIEK